MRYRLRTLVVLTAIGPPLLAVVLGATVDGSIETLERRMHFLVSVWLVVVVAMIVLDWQHSGRHLH